MQITAPTYIHPVVYNDFPILNIWLSLRKEILFKTAFVIKYVEGGGGICFCGVERTGFFIYAKI